MNGGQRLLRNCGSWLEAVWRPLIEGGCWLETNETGQRLYMKASTDWRWRLVRNSFNQLEAVWRPVTGDGGWSETLENWLEAV